MPTATKPVPDLVLDVLHEAVTDGNKLVIPRTLDRAEYVAVDKVLQAVGGKWNRGAKGHLWPTGTDAAEAIDPVLLTGTVTDERKQFDAFYTPPGVAQQVIDTADIGPGMLVLEPSAGDGALAVPARHLGAHVHAYELRDVDWKRHGVTHRGHASGGGGFHDGPAKPGEAKITLRTLIDFLTVEPDRVYDRVVMNPPFSNQADMRHVLHAACFVAPGGRLVAVMSPAFTFRTGRIAEAFRAWLNEHTHDIIELPEGSFRVSGTGVRTVILAVDL